MGTPDGKPDEFFPAANDRFLSKFPKESLFGDDPLSVNDTG
jgi:hypothetical protein